jgi:transcriptional regulator with XRE-family HTH domain
MEFLDEAEFNKAFQRRLKETRLERQMTHGQIAHALRIKEDAYKKYENRSGSAFPMYLLPQLVFVTSRPYSYWLEGQFGTKPILKIVK